MKTDKHLDDPSLNRGFQVPDANARKVAIWGVLIVVALLASIALLAVSFHWFIGDGPRLALGSGQHVPDSADAERTTIRASWEKLDAENRQHLHGYRWVDFDNGIVQIPIERAMELIAQPETSP